MKYSFFGLTDVGQKRSHNEDAFLYDESHGLAIVADGMGGHAAGEIASGIAVEVIHEFIETMDKEGEVTWPFEYNNEFSFEANLLIAGINLANDKILQKVEENNKLKGMGTTVVAGLFKGERVTIAHIGDSRAYYFRNGELSLITEDHSWVNEQLKKGIISEEQAREHPFKNVVTQALGSGEKLLVDIDEVKIEPEDIFLFCSDGVNSMLSYEEMQAVFEENGSNIESLGRKLIERANQAGGDDNITVVIVRAYE